MARLELRKWEIALLALSVLVLATGTVLFATRTSVRDLIFGALRVGEGAEIGRVSFSTGALRRKKLVETEFLQVKTNESLFQQDLVITGPEDSAKLELHDGSVIELGPQTMIRLVNESRVSLSGITRQTRIELVEGEVKESSPSAKPNAGQVVVRSAGKIVPLSREAKVKATPVRPRAVPPPQEKAAHPVDQSPIAMTTATPSPIPVPTKLPMIRLLAPADGEKFAVELGARKAGRQVRFSWSADVPETQFVLNRIVSGEPKVIATRTVQHTEGQVNLDLEVQESGEFEWQVRQSGRNWSSRFSVSSEFEAIQLRKPLVSGEQSADNRYVSGKSRKPFDLTLRWESYPGVAEYTIWTGIDQDSMTPVQKVKGTSFKVENAAAMSRPLKYRITAELPGGFVVSSRTDVFRFQLIPPVLTAPKNGTEVDSKILQSEKGFLLAWEKRSFTQGYALEIAKDPGFRQLVARTTIQENFHPVRSLNPGKYYWRVTALTQSGPGPSSTIYSFSIK